MKEKIVLTIFGVYLPHNDYTSVSVECYLETLDQLQSLIDSSGNSAPSNIVGDMNTCLPKGASLRHEWYRQRPFSKRSALLYNFLVDNELCVGNYAFKQNVNYTFKRNNVCSYIDYMFLPHYLLNKLVKCSVLHDCEDNVSDHLAISAQLQISVPRNLLQRIGPLHQCFPREIGIISNFSVNTQQRPQRPWIIFQWWIYQVLVIWMQKIP